MRAKLTTQVAVCSTAGWRVKRLCCEGMPVKVVIGAASKSYEGWLNTDLHVLDALDTVYLHMGKDTHGFQTL